MTSPLITPLTYNGYVTQIATMAVVNTTTQAGVVVGVDPAFNVIIPQMLNYAELRIQRDLDLLQAQTQNFSYSFTPGSQLLTIALMDFIAIQTLSVVVNGVTRPMTAVTQEWLQNTYGSAADTGVPQYFAAYGAVGEGNSDLTQSFLVGPTPAAAYQAALTGLTRLQTLAVNATTLLADTGTTFISSWLPDLLIQASMIYISQYQRNFGPAANDPQMGPTYELQYQTLLKGAQVEEARKNFEASGWGPLATPIAATPGR